MSLQIEKQISLAQYTTLQAGGVADYFVRVTSVDEFRQALQFAKQTVVPAYIIGGGSNLLVSDTGYRGLVIKNEIVGREYQVLPDGVVTCTCGAGETLDDVVAETVAKGYWGLENLSAIPGSVGATPIQNVGAYGVEVSALITAVTAIHRNTLEQKIFTTAECQFGYRDSFFKTRAGKEWCVVAVTFGLSSIPAPLCTYGDLVSLATQKDITAKEIRDTVVEIRATKFPDWSKVGTAGSFFKNPIISQAQYQALLVQYPDLPGYPLPAATVKVSLGWVLDKICNLRGYCEGKVCLYEKQALVLVSHGATAAEIDTFQEQVVAKVLERTGIVIALEVSKL